MGNLARLDDYTGSMTGAALAAILLSQTNLKRETKTIEGWKVNVRVELLQQNKEQTQKALELMAKQFKAIKRAVPKDAVKWLQTIPFWISPEYPGVVPRAEYHPGAQWLKENGRDPVMTKGIEVTNVRIFEAECKRMPVFLLHELAHAYHDQVLGFGNKRIISAFEHAMASHHYDNVERWDGKFAKAYAMSDPMEYFAEGTEAYFGKNDFYPFNREQLKKVDPELFTLMGEVWAQAPKVKS